jgi:hypothetical protein
MLFCAFPAQALEQACEGEICFQQPGLQVTFLLNESCTVGGSLQACIDSVESAMDVWNAPECSDLEILFGGTTPRLDIGYSQENPDANINLIYVQDAGWPHSSANPRVGTMAYDGQSGEILDYDIEVNNQYLAPSEVDLHNILARDFGMALGFEKTTGDADSIMWVSSGESKRVLSAGDTQALCRLYPLSEHQPPRSGCSCGGAPASTIGSLLVLLLSIGRLRGRRSRRDRSPGGRIRCRRTK